MKTGQTFNTHKDFCDALEKYKNERQVNYTLKNTKKLTNYYMNGKKRDMVQEGYKKELIYYQGTLQCSRAKTSNCEAKISFRAVDKNHLQLTTVNERHSEGCCAESLSEKAKTPEVQDDSEIDDMIKKIKNGLCVSTTAVRKKRLNDCQALLDLWKEDRSSSRSNIDQILSTPAIEEASSSCKEKTNICPSPQHNSGSLWGSSLDEPTIAATAKKRINPYYLTQDEKICGQWN